MDHVAGGALAGVDVTRGSAGRHVEHALTHVGVEDQAAYEIGAAPLPLAQQRRRSGGDQELGRRTETVIHLLSRGRREVDDQVDLGCHVGDRTLGAVRELVLAVQLAGLRG